MKLLDMLSQKLAGKSNLPVRLEEHLEHEKPPVRARINDQDFLVPRTCTGRELRETVGNTRGRMLVLHHIESQTEDAELKKLFAVLAQEESKHKLRLESEYDENVLMWA